MTNKIDDFGGPNAFLSNFYLHPVKYEGLEYPSSEHAYQAAKTLNMKARRAFTLSEMSAGMAKHLGAALEIRCNWDSIRLAQMAAILDVKFADPTMRAKLLATGDAELIEGNTWGDTFWGVCNGKGQNWLGKTLMSIRAKLNATD